MEKRLRLGQISSSYQWDTILQAISKIRDVDIEVLFSGLLEAAPCFHSVHSALRAFSFVLPLSTWYIPCTFSPIRLPPPVSHCHVEPCLLGHGQFTTKLMWGLESAHELMRILCRDCVGISARSFCHLHPPYKLLQDNFKPSPHPRLVGKPRADDKLLIACQVSPSIWPVGEYALKTPKEKQVRIISVFMPTVAPVLPSLKKKKKHCESKILWDYFHIMLIQNFYRSLLCLTLWRRNLS